MIDRFMREFDSCLVATAREREEWRAELVSHLEEAQHSGDLERALGRLGTPREAAAAFRSGRPLAAAPLKRRWLAQAIDHVPLLIMSILVTVQQIITSDGHVFAFGFPPGFVVSSGEPLLQNLGIPLALLWSWAGLALIEGLSRGRTPGKALVRLRTVSADGTKLSIGQAFARRWSILLGLLAWIDWAAALFTDRRQRLLDLLAKSTVVTDPERILSPTQLYVSDD